MNIITIFQQLITKNANQNIDKYLYNITKQFTNISPISNYQEFIEKFDQFTSNFTKDAYEAFILKLDEDFMRSDERKRLYGSKGFVTKPILTHFGLINFKRRKYRNKEDGTSFKFVDELLGIERYSRIDPFVIGELCEEATSNSYAKAGRNVSKNIGNKIKYNDDPNKFVLSRATTRNVVIKASEIIEVPVSEAEHKTISELTVMIDEKMVPSQFNDNKDHMVKSAVVFESYEKEYKTGNRTRLVNKHTFASIEKGSNTLMNDVADYIYFNYNTDKIERINILGDGANWIKGFAFNTTFKFHKNLTIQYGLDLFHTMQAIMRITTHKNKEVNNALTELLYEDKKEDFFELCNGFLDLNKHREETITKNKDYLFNNWQHIQNTLRNINYKCSMEAHISHTLADLLTARPKAYSEKGLRGLLKIRLLATNGYDLKRLYLDSLKSKRKKEEQITLDNRIVTSKKVNDKYSDYFRATLTRAEFCSKINNTNKIL